MADLGWSQQEIDASVDAYIEMLSKELAGEHYNKAAVNRDLREGVLASRSRGSVEMRMANISAVLNDKSKEYIQGYKPRKNVGSDVYRMIEAALSRHSDTPSAERKSRFRISLPDEIPASLLQKAVARIDRNGISPHSESHTYDVVIGTKKYPPVAVVAFAYEEMTGESIAPGTIRGGRGTQAFKILAQAGLEPIAKYFEPTIDNQELEDRVDEIRKNVPLSSPPKGNRRPNKRRVTDSVAVERLPAIKRWVLDNAGGVCELCREQSPYRSRAKDNPWYLEVHHVIPLKSDGPDTVCNAVALCPNCHTRCHQSIDANEATEMLYKQVDRLMRAK